MTQPAAVFTGLTFAQPRLFLCAASACRQCRSLVPLVLSSSRIGRIAYPPYVLSVWVACSAAWVEVVFALWEDRESSLCPKPCLHGSELATMFPNVGQATEDKTAGGRDDAPWWLKYLGRFVGTVSALGKPNQQPNTPFFLLFVSPLTRSPVTLSNHAPRSRDELGHSPYGQRFTINCASNYFMRIFIYVKHSIDSAVLGGSFSK